MESVINFIKDKVYYIVGITIVIILILIVISSCSNNGGISNYASIEQKMVNAAKEYYSNRKDRLPNENGKSVKVTINSLIERELIKEIIDPQNKEKSCDGYIEVTKVGEEFVYTPFLTCKGSYEPKYLTDKLKDIKTDEYGNGIYEMNGEFVFRGGEVNNYVDFNGDLWRIIKIDKDGDIEIMLSESTNDYYYWDTAYNSEENNSYGITTNYLNTRIRKSLINYYDENFSTESKAMIVSKNLCVGKVSTKDNFDVNKECETLKENEPIGLLRVSDYKNASLDLGCTTFTDPECQNYNYLKSSSVSTWLMTTVLENTYEAYYLRGRIRSTNASDRETINPVIYLTGKVVTLEGNGTYNDPYKIK